ncbi:hypothetical protein COEREDRAFT_14721 [Coemansia reversa NRRL 1564]|uniref:Uncharacterized protein n=1 Tax=Coemansia reversa (strain ATCC 12441 / NRRL 1564) TaxID=763665 RepID=A0A2G5BDZ5_COERN|nr:hypothetical protein COEREDRAFT_14721 [Coemansia reversa NRRL 1564]|eukprot:PIA17234.1 hypothetical protein COEREDRAFT_14721 [Coemansia reversa NRRL 1564]
MRFSVSLVAFSLATLVAASPVVRRDVINEVGANVHYTPGEYPGFAGGEHPGNAFPGGPGHDGPGHDGPVHGGPGHDGPGHGGPGHDGPGHDGPGHGGPGHDGPGHGGPGHGDGGVNACGVTPGQISALTPLLNKLGLSTTVNGVKQLVDKLLYSVGDLLESPGINGRGGLVDTVSDLVRGLLGQPLDLHNTVDALTEILETQVPCLLDTVLPKP